MSHHLTHVSHGVSSQPQWWPTEPHLCVRPPSPPHTIQIENDTEVSLWGLHSSRTPPTSMLWVQYWGSTWPRPSVLPVPPILTHGSWVPGELPHFLWLLKGPLLSHLYCQGLRLSSLSPAGWWGLLPYTDLPNAIDFAASPSWGWPALCPAGTALLRLCLCHLCHPNLSPLIWVPFAFVATNIPATPWMQASLLDQCFLW